MFLCNCPDALIKSSICKHIHLVARNIQTVKDLADIEVNESCSPEEKIEQSDLLSNLQDKVKLSDVSILRNEVQTSILSLAGCIQNISDTEILKEVRSRIVSATNFIKAKQTLSCSFANIKVEPATTHIQQQRKFFRLRKKGK